MLLFLFGLPCGLLAGLTGLAAGVVAGPLARFLLGLKANRLSGVTLTVTFFAALSAILSYSQHGFIVWAYVLVLVIGQAAGALLAQKLVTRCPKLLAQNWLWAALVVAIGLALCAHGVGVWHFQFTLLPGHSGLAALVVTLTCLAVLIGLASGVMGLGGVFTVPALLLVGGLSQQAAQGIAIAVLLIASLPGVLAHGARRDLEPASATWMSLGAIFGGLVGAFYAVSPGLTAGNLTVIYGVVLTVLGLSILWRNPDSAK